MQLLIWPFALLPALSAVAVATGRAAARGQRPWRTLAGIWLAVALAQYLLAQQFARPVRPAHLLSGTLVLLVPLGVAALVVEMEVQRGCSLRQAGSVAVLLGVAVAAALPFLLGYLSMVVTCVARANCL